MTILTKEVRRKKDYILTFKKLYFVLKIQSYCYYFLSFIFSFVMTYYLIIFCAVYKQSQKSLLINYLIGILESIITSIGISLIICFLRFIGLKCEIKSLYRTSVYLDKKF